MIIAKANLRVGFFVKISVSRRKLNQQVDMHDPGDSNGTNP